MNCSEKSAIQTCHSSRSRSYAWLYKRKSYENYLLHRIVLFLNNRSLHSRTYKASGKKCCCINQKIDISNHQMAEFKVLHKTKSCFTHSLFPSYVCIAVLSLVSKFIWSYQIDWRPCSIEFTAKKCSNFDNWFERTTDVVVFPLNGFGVKKHSDNCDVCDTLILINVASD